MEFGTPSQHDLAPKQQQMKKLEHVVSAAQRALEDPADFLELVQKHVGAVQQLLKLWISGFVACVSSGSLLFPPPLLLHVSTALPE